MAPNWGQDRLSVALPVTAARSRARGPVGETLVMHSVCVCSIRVNFRRHAAFLLFAAMGTFSIHASSATTWYVDRLSPVSSDANAGSSTSPWLTIQHGV